MPEARDREVFRELKPICVPLLENSFLTPAIIPRVLSLLGDLHNVLQKHHNSGFNFNPSLVSYTMFPLTSILRRNEAPTLPDRIVELLLLSLRILCEDWWWYCDVQTWEQLFMLFGAFVGGLEGKGKGKERDDESKEAAIHCLISLARPRGEEDGPTMLRVDSSLATSTLSKYTEHARSPRFVPILGQTVNNLTMTAGSPSLRLQRSSLELLCILLVHYLPEDFAPSVLPGVVSSMSRVSLGASSSKGWANGDIVSLALSAIGEVIIKAAGDAVCIRKGLVRDATSLDDLVALTVEDGDSAKAPIQEYYVPRTVSWLKAISSQLLMAVNALTPIVSHPTPTALLAICRLSSSLLESTYLTLPSCRPLLTSFLLSLNQSSYGSVSTSAYEFLIRLTGPTSKMRHSFLQILLQMTGDILSTLPRLLPTRADSKVEHLATQIEAVCHLATSPSADHSESFSVLSKGIGKLLGPMGGIERWGWRLLNVMEFDLPSITVTDVPAARLILESGTDSYPLHFPGVFLKHVTTRSAYMSLERMFRALGHAGGQDCIYAVEWFAAVGKSQRDTRGVSSLWLACRILEGIAGVSLGNTDDIIPRRSPRIDKTSRGLARSIAEIWDAEDIDDEIAPDAQNDPAEGVPDVEHVQGLIVLDQSLRIGHRKFVDPQRQIFQPVLHSMMALQVLSVTARILQAQFTSLLLQALYPVLHSIVSTASQLSESGLAALGTIAFSTSYASPANFLLSNFDYALDAISRRLTRQRLDIDAIKVLLVLVRLTGRNIIQKATDVVEECFDRLDEYHGYDVIVDGLVEVLLEVIKVAEGDEDSHAVRSEDPGLVVSIPPDGTRMEAFEKWFETRSDVHSAEDDTADYGPAPRRPWGKNVDEDEEAESGESQNPTNPDAEAAGPVQALAKQVVSRTIYFLTHTSATIRAKILDLLSAAVPVLPESALLTSIHQAWPFILNRLSDSEPFVVTAAAGLIEALSTHVGSYMHRRIWDDIWPRFREMLKSLEASDSKSALARRGVGSVGTESAYTQSHRLYRSMIKTMTAAVKNVQVNDALAWEVLLRFRRFLHSQAHEELQTSAVALFVAAGRKNADAVWLVLSFTGASGESTAAFLRRVVWDVSKNMGSILQEIDQQVQL
ncbi:ARM repeat-containing protein [Gloeopeniophorella convolvens]|nr:ARM repeat-containing protein [Gloeopeniophorella convolvens]